MAATFTLVAKDRVSQKPAAVHRLEPKSERETALYEWAKKHATQEKAEKDSSMFVNPPNAEDSRLLHSLFMGARTSHLQFSRLDDAALATIPMAATQFQTTHIMQPQEKNIHDKIFGGFLMRKGK